MGDPLYLSSLHLLFPSCLINRQHLFVKHSFPNQLSLFLFQAYKELVKTGRKIIIVLSDNNVSRSTVPYNTAYRGLLQIAEISQRGKPLQTPSPHYHHHHHHFGHTRSLLTFLFSYEFKAYLCFVICFLDRLQELFSRGNCQCRGEGFSDSCYGSGTTFWFIGCSGNWQDCKDPGLMTNCCREKGKK